MIKKINRNDFYDSLPEWSNMVEHKINEIIMTVNALEKFILTGQPNEAIKVIESEVNADIIKVTENENTNSTGE